MNPYPNDANPYSSPIDASLAVEDPSQLPVPRRGSLPVFCMVLFILDIVFLLIRVPVFLLGLAALLNPVRDPIVENTGIFEVATGGLMLLAGIPANIALLLKQRLGLILAWIAVIATVGSMGVGMAQGWIVFGQVPQGSAEAIGAVLGITIAMFVRGSLLALYVAALLKFTKAVS